MKIVTIGFTRKSAEVFFTSLQRAGLKRLVDVRLNNVSQLAGFTKKDDLRYFSRAVLQMEYIHLAQLAPTQQLLQAYRNKSIDWPQYESGFLNLMKTRKIEETVSREVLDGGCLLCSEEKPQRCHRRLVAEYLKVAWSDIEIEHIP
jgi:uncharacterized protein (DUF488 family)